MKNYDFENILFSHPVLDQCKIFTNILTQGFSKFVPTKTVTIRPFDAPWCNKYTRLLLRKKNRNYLLYKKCVTEYNRVVNGNNPPPDVVTRLLKRKESACKKSRLSANQSLKANNRVKANYNNSVNSLLSNPSISAKKKFGILIKLMKNNKSSSTPPLIEQDDTVNDSKEKSNIFNIFFASKSTVPNFNDPPPNLVQKEGISKLGAVNTKIIRNLKKSIFSHCGIPGKFLGLIATPYLLQCLDSSIIFLKLDIFQTCGKLLI